jgi:hypothetical protein
MSDLQIQVAMLSKTIEDVQVENERLRNELSKNKNEERRMSRKPSEEDKTKTLKRRSSMSTIVIDNIEKVLSLERANSAVLIAVGATVLLILCKLFFTYEEANYGLH